MKKALFALARASQVLQSRPRQSQSSIINYQLSIPLLLLLALFSTPAQAKYSGGAGTPEAPYKIADYNDLYTLADDTNDYNKCFVMTADIDLDPALPGRRQLTTALIASYPGPSFTGTFDGNDCNMLNLTIDTSGIGNDYLGLFGCTGTTAVISNLGVRDVSVTGGSESRYIGGLVGSNWDGTVMDCFATGLVTGDGVRVGGLVGENYGTVTTCFATGAVTGYKDAGGLVGWNYGSVTNCYATGPVTGVSCVGGLVGWNDYYGNVIDCYATGAVTANGSYVGGLVGVDSGGSVTGSFWDIETSGTTVSDGGMGLTTSQMQQAFYFQLYNWGGTTWTIDEGNDYPHLAWENAPGEFITDPVVTMAGSGTAEDPWVIESKDDFLVVCAGPFFWDKHYILATDIDLSGVTYVHGLIGYDNDNPFTGSFDGDGHIISNLTIEGGSNLGLFGYINSGGYVRNLGLEDVNITGTGYYVGGLAGYNYRGTVTNCYATGAVTGNTDVGGLVGRDDSGSVTDCYAAGSVTGDYDVGGLVGCNYYGTVTNCYATGEVTGNCNYVGGLMGYTYNGSVTNCYATGEVSGDDDVGGLVGVNDSGSVTNCYATGAVTGNDYVGGLVGRNWGYVTKSFWDIETSGTTVSSGGIGLTTSQMQTESTFTNAGWDFNDIWSICEGTNYPKLLWQQIPLADMLCPDGVTFIDYSYFAERWLWSDYGDVNGFELSGNGKIENADFALLANWWGQTSCGDCGGADYTEDNAVDSADLAILFDNWLATDYGDCEGAELTGDGFVDTDDALAFSDQWLQGF